MDVGGFIKDKRMEKNISQATLGAKVGVSKQMISQIERGTRFISLPVAIEVCRELGCELNDLVSYRETVNN